MNTERGLPSPSERGRFTLGGGILEYTVYGAGKKTVLLLHGNGEDHTVFSGLLPALTGAGYRVVAPDSRGQGHSDLGDVILDYDRMADDALYLLKRLRIDRPRIVGFSDGGIVALSMALFSPDLPESMVLVGANLTPCGIRPGARLSMFFSWLSARISSLFSEKRAREALLFKLMLTEPHIRAKSLQAIPCPVLVVSGEHDLISARHTRSIAAHLPRAESAVFPGAGHFLPGERPKELGEAILAFFARHGDRGQDG
ncbi:MAG: alpha/beta hydrolase [Clostridia bacterium]|nr:alpha/beta hydrolase [Clostridia bacterium]